jgi:hypothetical protein
MPQNKLYTCAKCGVKYPETDGQHIGNFGMIALDQIMLCKDCFKVWKKHYKKCLERWLKGQGEAFIFR